MNSVEFKIETRSVTKNGVTKTYQCKTVVVNGEKKEMCKIIDNDKNIEHRKLKPKYKLSA